MTYPGREKCWAVKTSTNTAEMSGAAGAHAPPRTARPAAALLSLRRSFRTFAFMNALRLESAQRASRGAVRLPR